VRGIVDPYGDGWNWRQITVDTPFSLPGLVVSAFLLSSKKPRYATGDAGGDWVVGLRIGDFVYAPCFGEWTDTLDEALQGARVALIDGTFLDAAEMPGITGHLPISESAPHLARHPGVRFLLTHLNNTNPLLTHPGLSPIGVASEMELL
jgi:pyrroloquinoline quinone biosynthesis protein B